MFHFISFGRIYARFLMFGGHPAVIVHRRVTRVALVSHIFHPRTHDTRRRLDETNAWVASVIYSKCPKMPISQRIWFSWVPLKVGNFLHGVLQGNFRVIFEDVGAFLTVFAI